MFNIEYFNMSNDRDMTISNKLMLSLQDIEMKSIGALDN